MTDIQKENKSGGKVPNLRFPEFTEQWESKPLREVVKINQGLQIAISERSTENKTGSYFYITNEFLKAGSGKKYYILNPPQSVICNEKDILMTRTGNTGQVVTNVSGAFHNNFFKVAYPEYIDKIFLYNFLKLNKTQNQILRFAGTSTIPDLNHSDFYRIIISFPSNKEQQKIASFLSLIDERITAQNKILIHLKSLIESLNDSLSEQKIRINSNFENWKKVRLGDLGYTFNGLSGKTKEDFGNGKRYIQYKQIFDSSKIVIENCGYVNVSENENQNSVKYGDIFFTISSETPDEIGMSSVLLEDVKNVYLNSFCFGFRLNSFKELLPEFARFLFRSKVVRNEIKKLAQGSTRYNMSKTEILKLEILLPSIKEQKEISAFLSSLSQKSQTEKAILEQLEMQKKYLLQQMFV